MKKILPIIFVLCLLIAPKITYAQVTYQTTENPRYNLPINPLPCNKFDPTLSCPVEMAPIYQRLNEPCSRSYEEFLTNPIQNHYWVEDPAITAQGKADERARQFLYWVISTSAVDEAPVLRSVWSISSTIALFGVVLIAVIFGIGYIVSQKTNYNFNIRIWPTLIKIGFMLLYIAFSAAIVFFLIQIAEVLMKFFYENLGGNDLFNIYFAPGPSTVLGRTEESYKIFYGCRDLNIRVNEGIDAEVFLLKMTNVTYYVMGTMILLRKILLWFLLFVSPFLALLMPFIFIRNTGWIWIGVFFQWLFYGPLLTLFLGGMAKIWKDGIPFNFDFSRVSRPEGYVYPTGINIVYGGPAQRIQGAFNRPIGADNNGNYVDTFAEYVITLIMLWAVTFFPWWLLRIFRDYCCEGILAMKNILLALYDQQRTTPPTPGPAHPPAMPSFKVDMKAPLKTSLNVPNFTMGSLGTIRTSVSVDIAKSLSLHMPKLTDIAKMETNKTSKSVVNQNITYLSNPVKAQTSADRQQFMNIRTELTNRAIKSDAVARTILASTSTSRLEKSQVYKEVLQSIPQSVTITQIVTKSTSQPVERVQNITNNFMSAVTNNNSIVNNIAKSTNTSSEVVKNIMQSYTKHMDKPISEVIHTIAQETRTSESTVKEVLRQNNAVMRQSQIINNTSNTEHITRDQTTKILSAIKSSTTTSATTSERIAEKVTTANESTNIQQMTKNIFESLTTNAPVLNQISQTTQVDGATIKNIANSFATHINESASTMLQSISRETNVSTNQVSHVLQTLSQSTTTPGALQQISEITHISQQHVQQISGNIPVILQSTSNTSTSQQLSEKVTVEKANVSEMTKTIYDSVINNAPALTQIAQISQSDESTVKNVIQTFENSLNQTTTGLIQNISSITNLSSNQIQHILQSTSQVITSPNIRQQISHSTQINEQSIQEIAGNIPVILQEQQATPSQEPVVKMISYTSGSSEASSQKAVQTLMTAVLADPVLMNTVQVQTGLQPQQIQNVITTYTQNLSMPRENLIQTINQTSGVSKENVQKTINTISDTVLTSQQVVQDVAKTTGMSEGEINSVMQNQMQIASAPLAHIEKTIAMPSSVSLEDYEEVKEMWTKHYEESDVPVSEKISNREDWIMQDIVFITNTLNKLLSTDPKLREEGLEELGYLLPVILINNLKGEELLVYLKAKLEAAKATLKSLRKDKNNVVSEAEEEEIFVDAVNKQEEEKHMEENTDEDAKENSPLSIEDREKVVQEKLSSYSGHENSDQSAQPPTTDSAPLEGIKEKLIDEAEKRIIN